MKNTLFLLFTLVALVFSTSCQKEDSFVPTEEGTLKMSSIPNVEFNSTLYYYLNESNIRFHIEVWDNGEIKLPGLSDDITVIERDSLGELFKSIFIYSLSNDFEYSYGDPYPNNLPPPNPGINTDGFVFYLEYRNEILYSHTTHLTIDDITWWRYNGNPPQCIKNAILYMHYLHNKYN